MKTFYNLFDSGLSFLGISVAVQDIESILSIILLVVSLFNLFLKFGVSFYNKIKDGKITEQELKEIEQESKELEQEINKVLNKEGE